MFKGELPWDDIEAQNKQDRYDLIYDKKASTPIEELCSGMPGINAFLRVESNIFIRGVCNIFQSLLASQV